MAILATLTATGACRSGQSSASKIPAATNDVVRRGGSLIASIRTEPGSFNRYVHRDAGAELVSILTQAKLVRINKATQIVEPWLADSWSVSEDGRAFTLKLHPGVTFSDGQPLTADDVVFSFRAVYDLGPEGPLGDALQVEGRKLDVAAVDASTVSIVFPVTYAPGVRILDNLPIFPKHKLASALRAGKIHDAWGLSTPPSELAGLGPFVLADYVPGQRLVFDRNPRYFRKAADGTALPYLDRVTVEITPDPNTELLRLEAGQIDAMTIEVAPESYATIKRAADAGKVKLADLGVGYNADALWFNLKPGAFAGDPREAWLQRDELRKAISLAVDRKIFADTVFLGAAEPVYGPETPANKQWYWGRPTAHDPAAARQLLARIGLTDRNGDGMLEDAGGRPARFTLLTQKGRPNLERSVAVIRDELKKIGIKVDVVLLEQGALQQRLFKGDFESILIVFNATNLDPAMNPDFWLSSGSAHVWNMAQATPATEWEKEIDDLMGTVMTSVDAAERKRAFDQVQMIFAENLPVLYFVAPRLYMGVSTRVGGLSPSILRPQLLWNIDQMTVKGNR
jgi:peptide/nickel transport system substrate-binding protein